MAYEALLAKQGLVGQSLEVKKDVCILVKDGVI